MTDEQRPQIMLDFKRDWCAKHLEPFRENWPEGAAIVMVLMATCALSHPNCHRYTNGDATKINAYLAEFSPICCRLPGRLIKRVTGIALRGEDVKAQHEQLVEDIKNEMYWKYPR